MERAHRSTAAILGRIVVLALLAAGTAGSARALVRVLEERVPLRLVLGAWYWPAVAALLAAVLLGSAELARELSALRRGGARPRTFAAMRALLVVGVLTWIAFLALVQPVEILWLEIVAGIASGAWCGWSALERRRADAPSKAARASGVLLFSLCAAALGLELSLRAIARVRPVPILARVGDLPNTVRERARFPPGFEYQGFRCNHKGYYDDEFRRRAAGEHRVVAIGDSFSTGAVPHAYHFTTVCERALGAPVDNMGINGIGPAEYLRILVEDALFLDPDVVVIDVFVGNDLVLYTPKRGKLHTLLEQWFDRGNVLLWTVPTRLARAAQERRQRGGKGPIASVESAAESALLSATATLEERFPWVLGPHEEHGTFSEASFLAIERQRVMEACRLTEPTLAPFFAKMLEMKHAAGSIPLCVLLIPDEFQVEDAVWEKALEGTSEQDLERDRAQRLVVPWFERNGIPCLDLLPLLRAVPPMEDGRRHVYHLRDTHFNARGNKVAGGELARFLGPLLEKRN